MDRDALVDRCKTRFKDPQNRTHSDEEWVDYINDSLADIYAARSDWPFAENVSTAFTLSPGSVGDTLPEGMMRVTAVFNETDDVVLQPLHGHDAHYHQYLDNTEAGTPRYYRVHGGDLLVYPAASVATSFRVEGYAALTELDAGSDSPSFDARFHRILVAGALRYAYEDDGNADAAATFQARFDRMLGEMVDAYFRPRHGGYPQVIDDF